jgi:hypothetical protein
VEIPVCLGGLGLERYEPAFRENKIDAEGLPELTEAHLATRGILLGPRLKLVELRDTGARRERPRPTAALEELAGSRCERSDAPGNIEAPAAIGHALG